jgi:hypothetical protein
LVWGDVSWKTVDGKPVIRAFTLPATSTKTAAR